MGKFYGYRGMTHGGNGEWDWTPGEVEVVTHECSAGMERRTIECLNHGATPQEIEYAANVRNYCGIPDHVGVRVIIFKDGHKVVGLVRELPVGTIVKISTGQYPVVEFRSLDPLDPNGAIMGGGTPIDEQWMGKAPESYF